MYDYTKVELMVCSAARILENNSTIVVGTGIPCAASMLSQKLFAPNLIIMYEAGGIAPLLPSMPISVADSRTFYKAIKATSMSEIMEICQRGMVDFCFIGGAQIDKYGNVNSTIIGNNFRKPKIRFPGSGGANDIASLCWKSIIIMIQDRRKFVKKIDFITTPGYLTGKGAREKAGLPPGTGPYKVITNLAIIGFDEVEKCMKVESIHPGITKEEVIQNTEFDLMWEEEIGQTQPPTPEELKILREEVDPYGYVTGRK